MNIKNLSKESLNLHYKLTGKLEVNSKYALYSRKRLSLLYTPGVASVVKKIQKYRKLANKLTIKANTIAVISDGSAVLGLGNVGPEAAIPVMEGKCAIFKEFANLNAFPICLSTQIPSEIIKTIKNISPIFSAICLEDIAAPNCFEIESKLQNIGIPVLHDDQHATAITVLAGLSNALKISGRKLENSKIVIVGAGAAGYAISNLLSFAGAKNILCADSQGIISRNRQNLPNYKKEILENTNHKNISGDIYSSVAGADVLIGVSKKGLFTQKILNNLSQNPIVFALANPDPEVSYDNARKWGVRIIATGRSDYPNQINNALVFPGLFKGLLASSDKKLTLSRKLNTAKALSEIVNKPSEKKFIPSIFDKSVANAVAGSLVN